MKQRQIKFRIWDSLQSIYINGAYSKIEVKDNILSFDTPDYWIFQQFTAIKDRNGKEIFEGDIVNVNGGNHIIEWRGAGFAATWSDYNLDTCWFMGGGPVVIGNIFENPELAEKAQKSPNA